MPITKKLMELGISRKNITRTKSPKATKIMKEAEKGILKPKPKRKPRRK